LEYIFWRGTVTVRINAHHIICPSCQEKVFLDELVSGHCPLCGCMMEEGEISSELEHIIERSDIAWIIFHYFVFKKFDALGVSPLQILQVISQLENQCESEFHIPRKLEFRLEIPMNRLDRVRIKRCSKCRKLFMIGGKKIIFGNFNSNDSKIEYICQNC